jgi:hypothetical protein
MNWISVKDRLPEVDSYVLCWGDTSHKWGRALRKVKVRYLSPEVIEWQEYCDVKCVGLQYIIDVTHWMSLPKDPDGTETT